MRGFDLNRMDEKGVLCVRENLYLLLQSTTVIVIRLTF
jgi:hypothetical protein